MQAHANWKAETSDRKAPLSFESTSHLQLVGNGQRSSKHVTLIQNHPQPMYLQPAGQSVTVKLQSSDQIEHCLEQYLWEPLKPDHGTCHVTRVLSGLCGWPIPA